MVQLEKSIHIRLTSDKINELNQYALDMGKDVSTIIRDYIDSLNKDIIKLKERREYHRFKVLQLDREISAIETTKNITVETKAKEFATEQSKSRILPYCREFLNKTNKYLQVDPRKLSSEELAVEIEDIQTNIISISKNVNPADLDIFIETCCRTACNNYLGYDQQKRDNFIAKIKQFSSGNVGSK